MSSIRHSHIVWMFRETFLCRSRKQLDLLALAHKAIQLHSHLGMARCSSLNLTHNLNSCPDTLLWPRRDLLSRLDYGHGMVAV